MDKIIRKVLENLEKEGFEAYLVGGYVRDHLLGVTSFDVDIATNALPKDIKRIFNVVNDNYGSCNLKIKQYNIDITTFRKDKNYINGKPSEVEYINDLKSDLLRRDFTINAICMDKSSHIIDILNGCEDLDNFIIKSIGNADLKLKEDPLRILRAIRFSALLDFKIDEDLLNSIKNNAHLVANISKEKIKSELDKILISNKYLKALNLFDELNISEVINLEYNNLVYCNDLMGMYAQIKVELSFTKEQKDTIIKIQEVLKEGSINQFTLYKYGLYICTVAAKILGVDNKKINNIYRKLPIKSKSDIAINGNEIASILGIEPSIIIKEVQNDVENALLTNKLKNKYNDIKRYIIQNKERWLS